MLKGVTSSSKKAKNTASQLAITQEKSINRQIKAKSGFLP